MNPRTTSGPDNVRGPTDECKKPGARVRPILFSAPMVLAIAADQKTQTRRIVKLPAGVEYDGHSGAVVRASAQDESTGSRVIHCPYGVPADRLAVKEHAWIWCERIVDGQTPTGRPKHRFEPVGQHVVYKADSEKPTTRIDDHPARGWRLKLGRYLPRWAVRHVLEVVAVRVERLQDITEEDARAEGVRAITDLFATGAGSSARDVFAGLWQDINGERASWASNPWVWVVSFKRVEKAVVSQ